MPKMNGQYTLCISIDTENPTESSIIVGIKAPKSFKAVNIIRGVNAENFLLMAIGSETVDPGLEFSVCQMCDTVYPGDPQTTLCKICSDKTQKFKDEFEL